VAPLQSVDRGPGHAGRRAEAAAELRAALPLIQDEEKLKIATLRAAELER